MYFAFVCVIWAVAALGLCPSPNPSIYGQGTSDTFTFKSVGPYVTDDGRTLRLARGCCYDLFVSSSYNLNENPFKISISSPSFADGITDTCLGTEESCRMTVCIPSDAECASWFSHEMNADIDLSENDASNSVSGHKLHHLKTLFKRTRTLLQYGTGSSSSSIPTQGSANATVSPTTSGTTPGLSSIVTFQGGNCQYYANISVFLNGASAVNGWVNVTFNTTVNNVTADCGNGNQTVQLSNANVPNQVATPVSGSMAGCSYNGTIYASLNQDQDQDQSQDQSQNQWQFTATLAINTSQINCGNGLPNGSDISNQVNGTQVNGTQINDQLPNYMSSLPSLPLPFSWSSPVNFSIASCNYSGALNVTIQNQTNDDGNWSLGISANMQNVTSDCNNGNQGSDNSGVGAGYPSHGSSSSSSSSSSSYHQGSSSSSGTSAPTSAPTSYGSAPKPAPKHRCRSIPKWSGNGVHYSQGSCVCHNGKSYVAIQGHTSQPAWAPCTTSSLWRASRCGHHAPKTCTKNNYGSSYLCRSNHHSSHVCSIYYYYSRTSLSSHYYHRRSYNYYYSRSYNYYSRSYIVTFLQWLRFS